MFEFEDLPLSPIDPGTNVLVTGPATGDPLRLLLGMIGPAPGEEGSILVATTSNATTLVGELHGVRPAVDLRAVGVVDATGGDEPGDVGQFRTVMGPVDLAGIGNAVSIVHETFAAEGAQRIRIGVESISTVLKYLEIEPVFQFLQVSTRRVASANGLGVYGIDPGIHDDPTVQPLHQLFDGRIEVRTESERPELRVRGLADQPRQWQPFY